MEMEGMRVFTVAVSSIMKTPRIISSTGKISAA